MGQVFAAADHVDRAMGCTGPSGPFGSLGRGDDDGRSAGTGHHDLEHVEGIGHHLGGQHVVDGDRLAEEDGIGVGAGVGPLVGRDLGRRPRVVAEFGAVPVGDHGVAAVLGQVPVGDLELGLG